MKRQRPIKSVLRYLLLMAFVGVVCGLWGCQAVGTRIDAAQPSCPGGTAELQDAMDAFYKGDYNSAERIFEAVSRQAANGIVQRRALYGLACTMLAKARSERDVEEAMIVWNRWEQLNPTGLDPEDPLMLSPFFDKITVSGIMLSSPCPPETSKLARIESCKSLLDKKDKEIQIVKSKLESRNKETKALQKNIQQLKQQIESLEAIHLEIQEKKKEVSSR